MTPRQKPKPKNSPTWVELTKDFVKEWPEVLDGLEYKNLPIKYVKWCELHLKSKITIKFDIENDLKTNKQSRLVRILRQHIIDNRHNIKSVKMKFNIQRLKADMESRTEKLLGKTFKK